MLDWYIPSQKKTFLSTLVRFRTAKNITLHIKQYNILISLHRIQPDSYVLVWFCSVLLKVHVVNAHSLTRIYGVRFQPIMTNLLEPMPRFRVRLLKYHTYPRYVKYYTIMFSKVFCSAWLHKSSLRFSHLASKMSSRSNDVIKITSLMWCQLHCMFPNDCHHRKIIVKIDNFDL